MTSAVAVLARTVRLERRSALVWAVSLGVLGGLMAAIHPSIAESLDELTETYPPAILKAFGIEDLASVEGYVHAEVFSLIYPLALGFFAVRLVASAIAGAEERGELDVLLGLPLSRRSLLAGDFAAAIVLSAAVLALAGALVLAGSALAGAGLSAGALAEGAVGVWGVAVFAAGVSALACGALHRGRAATAIAMGVLVAMYLLDVAGRLSDPVEPGRWASAFRYYGAPMTEGLDAAGLLALVACGSALAAVAAVLFARRDVLR